MMKSTDHRNLNDVPLVRRLHGSRIRRVLFQREVRAAAVIMREITPKEPEQVMLVEDDHMVDTISA